MIETDGNGIQLKKATAEEVINDLAELSKEELMIMVAVLISWHHETNWTETRDRLITEIRKELNNGN